MKLRKTRADRRRNSHVARPRRLHAERLEDRFLMTGNSAGVAFGSPSTQVAVVSSASHASATDAASASHLARDSWDRFQSTAELEAWLVEAATSEWGHLFGKTQYYPGWYWYSNPTLTDGLVFRTMATNAMTLGFDADYSTTNVQVAAVDEADLVETDGEFLYIISGRDLVIVQAGEGDDLSIVSRTRLAERPTGMFLSGNRLAILSTQQVQPSFGENGIFLLRTSDYGYPAEVAKPTTTVTVLDITRRSDPRIIQKAELDGELIASRTVDGELRLVLSNQIHFPPPNLKKVESAAGIESAQGDVRLVEGEIVTADRMWFPYSGDVYVYETQEEYLARVRDEIIAAIRPRLRNLASDDSVISDRALVEATDLPRPDSIFGRFVTTIATFDLNSNRRGPVETESVITGSRAQVYATADSMYVFAQRSQTPSIIDGTLMVSVPKSDVWKFKFGDRGHDVQMVAKGEFDGALLNQFASDEHNGFLRIVSKADGFGAGSQMVHVLKQVGRQLETVGRISEISPNELLYSVRFVGDHAFLVTFRQTDPLFVVDLSDPANPQLLGELHIPGYSDYLQPIDETHLLAIGRGADETTGAFQELQISLFDVSDLANPRLVGRYSFGGGRTTATPATGDRWVRGDGDHHAVSYFADEQILALPVFTAENSWFGSGETPLFAAAHGGLEVFKIDLETGFTPLGRVEHDSLVERSVRIGDQLYGISSGAVTAHELADPTTQLGEVSIAAEGEESEHPIEGPLWQTKWQGEWSIRELSLPTLSLAPFAATIQEGLLSLPEERLSFQAAASDSGVGWVLPFQAQSSRYTQPAQSSLVVNKSVAWSNTINPELLNLLALEVTSQETSSDDFVMAKKANHASAEVNPFEDGVVGFFPNSCLSQL